MNKTVTLKFIAAINSGNVENICSLMTKDHLFIDSQDNRLMGRDNMKQAWIGYFALFPDYKIEVSEILERDSLICVLGYASATYKNLGKASDNNYWRIPAAWSAVIEHNSVKVWQVYADNSVVLEIVNRNK
jgi:ketosteroid isomerase-like protein